MRVSSNQGGLHNTQTHCVGLSLLHFCRLHFFFFSPSPLSVVLFISSRYLITSILSQLVNQRLSLWTTSRLRVIPITILNPSPSVCLTLTTCSPPVTHNSVILIHTCGCVCEAIVARVSLVFVLCPLRVCVSAEMLHEGITRVQLQT